MYQISVMRIFLCVAVEGYGILKPWDTINSCMEWSWPIGQIYLHNAAKGLIFRSPYLGNQASGDPSSYGTFLVLRCKFKSCRFGCVFFLSSCTCTYTTMRFMNVVRLEDVGSDKTDEQRTEGQRHSHNAQLTKTYHEIYHSLAANWVPFHLLTQSLNHHNLRCGTPLFFQAAGNSKNFIVSVASRRAHNCNSPSMIKCSSKVIYDEISLLPLLPATESMYFNL